MKKTAKPLTDQEETFASLVANGMMQFDAFTQVYPERAKRMQKASLHVTSTRLAAKCSERIKEIQESRNRAITRRLVINAESWAEQVARMAFYDARALVDPETGEMLKLHQLDDNIAAAIEGVEMGKDGVKYRLAKKSLALDAIAKRLALYQEGPPPLQPEDRPPVNTTLLARKLAVLLLSGSGVNDVETIEPIPKTNGSGT